MKSGSFLLLFDKSKTKIFLVLRSDFPVWGLTGGGLNECEKPDDGAKRESVEETGFEVKLIKYIGKYKNNNNYIIFVYEG
jgi:ADP-ribose pyrophosphatase YjhB (NUDIX family)